LFDGNKLAWSLIELPIGDQLSMVIDLDEGELLDFLFSFATALTNIKDDERAKRSKTPRDNKHRIVIRKAGTVPMQVLDAYLNGKIDYDPTVLVGINFLDHLIRETPAKKYVPIKRSFYSRTGCRELEGGVEAWKGIFQSIRAAQGGRLIMNVDVTTSCFWREGSLIELALNVGKVCKSSPIDPYLIDQY